jgi:hypothetical protein
MFAFDPKGPASGGKFRIHLPEVLKFDELTLKNIILAIVIMKPLKRHSDAEVKTGKIVFYRNHGNVIKSPSLAAALPRLGLIAHAMPWNYLRTVLIQN